MVSKDHCMHIKRITRGIIFPTLYVDDIMLVGNNLEMTKKCLSSVFEMDMDEARYVLGVEIIRNHLKKLLGICH